MFEYNQKVNIGLDNFVLLENYTDENAFVENLLIRHESDLIYVKNIIFGFGEDTVYFFLKFFCRHILVLC